MGCTAHSTRDYRNVFTWWIQRREEVGPRGVTIERGVAYKQSHWLGTTRTQPLSTWWQQTWDTKGQHLKLHVFFFPTWNHKGRENRGRANWSQATQLHICSSTYADNRTLEVGAPRPRSSACAKRAPCAIPSGHSAVPPFRWRSFSKHCGGHFTKKKKKKKKKAHH